MRFSLITSSSKCSVLASAFPPAKRLGKLYNVVMPKQKKKRLIRTRTFFLRIVATFIASALSVVGLGSVFGMDLATSALFAGCLGIASVAQDLATAYLKDGKLTMAEINYAFNHYDSKLNSDDDEMSGGGCHCVNCCPNTEYTEEA